MQEATERMRAYPIIVVLGVRFRGRDEATGPQGGVEHQEHDGDGLQSRDSTGAFAGPQELLYDELEFEPTEVVNLVPLPNQLVVPNP